MLVNNAGPSNVTGATVADMKPFFFNDTATTEIYTLSLHGALPTSSPGDFSDTVNINAGAGNFLTYTVVATISASPSRDLVNTATVAGPLGMTDPTPGNNTAIDTDTSALSADLSISKTDGAASYTPGG